MLPDHILLCTYYCNHAFNLVLGGRKSTRKKQKHGSVDVDMKSVCGKCHVDSEEAAGMIQCDICDQWFHLLCVHVDPDEADFIDFQCPDKCVE